MTEYNAQSIEVLSGLEPVRKRPGMYTETEEPNHLAQEVIDNSVDEAIAGFADTIDVILHTDGGLSVSDNGRGMPVDIHPKENKPGVEVILSKLHAGGKFNNENYKFSGGLHGVGVSVVNALSDKLVVQIKRDGKKYQIEFAHGKKTQDLAVIDSVPKKDKGTLVKFYPEAQFFDNSQFNLTKLKHNLRSKAVLCSGLTINFSNEQDDSTQSWCYQNGLIDYLQTQTNGLECLPAQPLLIESSANGQELAVAFLWAPEINNAVSESFVNLIPTKLGGTHVNGLRQGLFEAITEFCEFHSLLPKTLKISADDVWQQISFVLSVKMLDPQFSGQTKERLSSRSCASFVANGVKDKFALWLSDNVEVAKAIVEITLENARKRERNSKKIVRKKITQGPTLPGKLADCVSTDLDKTEIFLVEGDSAGGSAKQARDKDYQAILPLRGKILNTWDIHSDEILASNEIFDITTALGIEPGSADLSNLRYGKICILADADSDGAHIATLICALFTRHFPEVLRKGHLFVAMPPLYRIDAAKEVHYALDDVERDEIISKLSAKVKPSVQRFKGLGEMDPSQLRETTMLEATRRLVQLTLDDDNEEAILDMLLNKKRAGDRKNWLNSKGSLADIA
jgi:topoisomerase-4 subunit B